LKILVLGGDGYLGWSTTMTLAAKGFDICMDDNYLSHKIAMKTCSGTLIP